MFLSAKELQDKVKAPCGKVKGEKISMGIPVTVFIITLSLLLLNKDKTKIKRW